MKTALLAAAIGFAIAPIAHAQAVCGDVPRLAGYALNDFDDIADEELSDDLFSVTEALANADQCGVSYEFDSTYACMWVYDNAASARPGVRRPDVGAGPLPCDRLEPGRGRRL